MRWRRLPVEDTPLGQSLDGSVERGALKLLDEHSASMPTGERVAQVALGYRNGYQVHWGLTGSHLLILPVVRVPGTEVESVARENITAVQSRGPVRRYIRARVGDGYRISPDSLVFSSDRVATFSGEQVQFQVAYLGGHPSLAEPCKLFAIFDDEALHLLTTDGCIERLRVGWGEVAELVVGGVEETQRRITATRLLTVGVLALAIPKQERHDRAYITVTSAGWRFVLRADQVSPFEARAKLGGHLSRVAAAAAPDVRSDGLASALSRVVEMHGQGALTDAEFAEAKRRILQGD